MTLSDKVITIDGPSGVGKGTLAYWLAAQLGFGLLDSGLIYRYFAWLANHAAIEPTDAQKASLIGKMATGYFIVESGSVQLIHNRQNITNELRTEETAKKASEYSSYPHVRKQLEEIQQLQNKGAGLVADGRDMGTVIFPNARLKFFLTASAEIRAKRRYKQLHDSGSSATLAALLQVIQERDKNDADRTISPLKPADDAIVIDTSHMTLDEVKQKVLRIVLHYFNEAGS